MLVRSFKVGSSASQGSPGLRHPQEPHACADELHRKSSSEWKQRGWSPGAGLGQECTRESSQGKALGEEAKRQAGRPGGKASEGNGLNTERFLTGRRSRARELLHWKESPRQDKTWGRRPALQGSRRRPSASSRGGLTASSVRLPGQPELWQSAQVLAGSSPPLGCDKAPLSQTLSAWFQQNDGLSPAPSPLPSWCCFVSARSVFVCTPRLHSPSPKEGWQGGWARCAGMSPRKCAIIFSESRTMRRCLIT